MREQNRSWAGFRIGCFLACLGLISTACGDTVRETEKETSSFTAPQNVVVILADDHALPVTGSYGNKVVQTPNIDRLAQAGLTFDRSYCNAPICSASRASLLTGKYPHATGVNLLFTPFPDAGNVTIAEHLRSAGWATGLVGKTHFNNWAWASLYKEGLPKHGFDTLIERAAYRSYLEGQTLKPLPEGLACYTKADRNQVAQWMNAGNLPHPVWDAESEGTFYARSAIQFMQNHRDEPFFLWVAFKEPHHPYYYPLEFADRYRSEDMPLPMGSEEDERWIPAKFRGLSDEEKRGIIAAYYTSTSYMDKNVGLVLDAIDALDLAENTLVVYLSDNGYLLHDHRRFEKHTMWEEAVKQPMIFRYPGQSRRGERSSALVEYVDVVPTILALLEVPRLTTAQGKSFAPVLTGASAQHKEFALATYLEDNLAMVVNQRWKYMFTTGSRDLGISYQTGFGPSGIVHRLYDLKTDPKESKSLANDPEHQSILQEMQAKMIQRFEQTHPDAERCPAGLSTEGKLVWYCEPRDIGTDQSLHDVPIRVFQAN